MNKFITGLFILCTLQIFSQKNNQVLVPFLAGEKYGFASTDGKIIIPPKYEAALPFYKGYELSTVFLKGNSLVINRKGKVILKGSSDYFRKDSFVNMHFYFSKKPEVFAIREYCQLDSCPKFGITEAFDEENLFDKMDGLYFVSNQQKVFLINEKGKRKTDYYDRIRHIDYGEIEYCITEDRLNQKYGLLDENGKVLLNCAYDAINYKGKGVFIIKQSKFEQEFMAKTKVYTARPINEYKQGNYKIKRKNRKAGIVDSTDKVIVPYTYNKLYPLNNDKFIFWKGKEVGLMDAKENIIYSYALPFDFSETRRHNSFIAYVPYHHNMVFFNRDNKWLLIDLNGQQIGEKYDGVFIDPQNITGIMAGVCIADKLGVITKNGKFILNPSYNKIYCLKEDNSFVVKSNGKWSWLDAKGKPIYKDFNDFGYILKNFLFVMKDEKWFYVSSKGAEFKE